MQRLDNGHWLEHERGSFGHGVDTGTNRHLNLPTTINAPKYIINLGYSEIILQYAEAMKEFQ